jgi:hypothetical protein
MWLPLIHGGNPATHQEAHKEALFGFQKANVSVIKIR